jgi:hypothetical protein
MIERFTSPFHADSSVISEPTPVEDKPRMVEIVALLVTCISVILAQFQRQQTRSWALISVGFLVAVLAARQPLISWVRASLRTAADTRVASRNRQELRRLSKEAGDFLDLSRSDALQGVLQRVTGSHPELLTARIAPVAVFQDHWYYLDNRIQHGSLTTVGFHDAAEELLSLLRACSSFCVLPMFRIFAAEFREILNDNEKSELNAFQQRYVSFVSGYVKYLIRLNDEFHSLAGFKTGMAYPPPL